MSLPALRLIVGEFGSGKSLRLLELGCKLANRYKKAIVANFPINRVALTEYARIKGYKWLQYMCTQARGIRYIPVLHPKQLGKILDCRNSVILLDEAGIFLNARSWSQVPSDFLGSCVQQRKDFNVFILAAQYVDQVDKQIRENCQEFTLCRGTSVPGSGGNPHLVFRHYFVFKPSKFHRWLENPQWQDNYFRTFISASTRTIFSPVLPFRFKIQKDCVDIDRSALSVLFECFDSFARLDRVKKPYTYVQYPD